VTSRARARARRGRGLRSGYALPSSRIRRHFLILIDALFSSCLPRSTGWHGEGGDEERTLAESYRTWSRQLANRYPFISRMLNDMTRMYDHDASWHDTDSKVRRRLEI
jgi:hypothetical protein